MATVFTRILSGELPAQFVWSDETCAAFLSINPLRAGHVLVVPRREVDSWLDCDDDLLAHLLRVARRIGLALRRAFPSERVGLIIAGLEVAHVHLHVVPIDTADDLNFANAQANPDPAALNDAAQRVRAAVHELGGADRTGGD